MLVWMTEKINEFVEIYSEYFQKSKNILLSQRAELLLKIRDGQEKLYCLDYLTRTLNQAGIFDKK